MRTPLTEEPRASPLAPSPRWWQDRRIQMHLSKICDGGDQHHHRYDQRQRPGHGVVYRVSGGTSSNLATVALRRVGSNRCLDDTS
jgi:hypothetical protein